MPAIRYYDFSTPTPDRVLIQINKIEDESSRQRLLKEFMRTHKMVDRTDPEHENDLDILSRHARAEVNDQNAYLVIANDILSAQHPETAERFQRVNADRPKASFSGFTQAQIDTFHLIQEELYASGEWKRLPQESRPSFFKRVGNGIAKLLMP